MKDKYIDKNKDSKRVYFGEEKFKRIYINGEKSKYKISNWGKVINTKTDKEIKLHYDGKYYTVRLTHNGKTKGFKIHRLVAEYFIPNSDQDKTQVNHIDGRKWNNCYDNLEWTTPSENMIHSVMNNLKSKTVVLSIDDVHKICKLIATGKYKSTEIADKVGCSKYNVKNIKNKIAWRHISDQYF